MAWITPLKSSQDPAFIAALGHLTHLRHLEINLTTSGSFGLRAPFPDRSPPSSHAYIHAIITLLQSIPSLALQQLRIQFWQDAASFHEPGSPEPATTALALQRLDQHLTTTYSELSSVTFILSSTGPITTRQEEAARIAITLERDLPGLKTRKLLTFASDPGLYHLPYCLTATHQILRRPRPLRQVVPKTRDIHRVLSERPWARCPILKYLSRPCDV